MSWIPARIRCIPPILILFLILAAFAAPCLAYGSGATDSPGTPADITETSAHFESIRTDTNELYAFFLTMPKGGDIHNHLTGAVYAEDVIDISARHGILVDPATGQLYDAGTTEPGLVPVTSAYSNTTLYLNLVDAWFMRDYPENAGSGRQCFFATFSLVSPAKTYLGEMIATLRNRAAEENLMYIESMVSVPGTSADVQEIKSNVAWNDTLSAMREDLLDAGLRDVCRESAERLEAYDAESWNLSTPGGKNVTMWYLYEGIRILPKKDVYTNLVQAFETANQSPLIVGVNFVGEEDMYYARTDYHLHMEMIGYLQSVYPDVPVALHAGEQTMGLVPPEDLRFHIADAIHTAHASRIGHGVDIMYETDSEEILAVMRENSIPIEVLFTSNDQILHVGGSEHPVSLYLSHDVPVVLATDDPGVERTDLTEQYVLLASRYPELSYEEIRTINQNGIRYSFLPEQEKSAMFDHLNGSLGQFESAMAAA